MGSKILIVRDGLRQPTNNQVGSNKKKIQMKYKIENKQSTVKEQSMQTYG